MQGTEVLKSLSTERVNLACCLLTPSDETRGGQTFETSSSNLLINFVVKRWSGPDNDGFRQMA